MDRPVPNRGPDHKGDGNIDEGIRPYIASLTPVKARMRDENANTAHQQSENAQHDDPVSDTDDRAVTRPGPGPIERSCNASYGHDLTEVYTIGTSNSWVRLGLQIGHCGEDGRKWIEGPGRFNFDANLIKRVKIAET